MIDDPLRPFLDRVGKIKSISIEMAESFVRALKAGGATSAELEQASEYMAKASEYQALAMEKLTEAARNNATLEAELIRVSRHAPEIVERLADTETIIRLMENLLASDPVIFSRIIQNVPADGLPLAVQEAASYDGGEDKLRILAMTITAILGE